MNQWIRQEKSEMNNSKWKGKLTFKESRDLSIGKKSVHSFQEAWFQDIWLVKDKGNLLILAAWTAKNGTQILIKIFTSVLVVNLKKSTLECNFS